MPETKTKNQPDRVDSKIGPKILKLRHASIEIVIMILVAATVPVLVYLDMIVLFSNVSERSLTETSQLLLLGTSTVLFASGAYRLPQPTNYLSVLALFSLLMFIRENDGMLDQIASGFWLYPALVCIAAGVWTIRQNVGAFNMGFLRHFSSRYGLLVFVGLFVLIVFSRAFGSGFLWRPILADNYAQPIKAAIQEGLELLGYAIFTFGTIGSWKNDFR